MTICGLQVPGPSVASVQAAGRLRRRVFNVAGVRSNSAMDSSRKGAGILFTIGRDGPSRVKHNRYTLFKLLRCQSTGSPSG